MNNILEEIIRNKKREIKEKTKTDRNFLESIRKPEVGDVGLIAEIKLASPSEGNLGREKDVVTRAVMYEEGGVEAISVVTDNKYFGGRTDFVRQIKNVVSLPVLMKDFILDHYQVYEAKMIGADALLFIAKILTPSRLKELVALAKDLGIEPVVEVGNDKELDMALGTESLCIGVNARNLTDFGIDTDKACNLIRIIPKDRIALGFSGVKGREEARKYKKAGAKAILVGTALMRTENIKDLIKNIKGI